MKQFSGIITSIAEPWCIVDFEEWRWEQLKILNWKGLLKALRTLNLPWKVLMLPESFFFFLVGTLVWFDKSYANFDFP